MTKKAEKETRRKIALLIQLWETSGMRYIGFPVSSYAMKKGDIDNMFHLSNVKEWCNVPISRDMLYWANEIWKQLTDTIRKNQ